MKTIPIFLLSMLGVVMAAEPATTTPAAPAAKKAKGKGGYPPEFSGARVVNYKTVGEVFEKNYGRVPQTAVATHADWLLEGDAAQAMITAAQESNRNNRDLLIKPTLTTSGSVDFVCEYLDTLRKAA